MCIRDSGLHGLIAWPQDGKDKQGNKQQLQPEEDIPAELLPDGIDVHIFNRPTPKIGARNDQRGTFQFQKVE